MGYAMTVAVAGIMIKCPDAKEGRLQDPPTAHTMKDVIICTCLPCICRV